jgi:hypothetical protein
MMSTGEGQPPLGPPEHRIANSFNAYFENFDVRIAAEEVVVGNRRTIRRDGWAITYRIDSDDAGMPSLEFYATHRMTNDRHVAITAGGQLECLDAISEILFLSKPGAAEEFAARNETIEEQLHSRGLYPHGPVEG